MVNTVDIAATTATAFLPKFDPCVEPKVREVWRRGRMGTRVCECSVVRREINGDVRTSYLSVRREINKAMVI